jgi:hypothetical protein
MSSLPIWRRCLFSAGVIGLFASIVIMAIGVARAHQTTDYLEQARIAIPFIRWGTLCSLISLLLSGFGPGLGRWIALICSALLLAWWLLIAVPIY